MNPNSLLSREQFRERSLKRDKGECVCCKKAKATTVHHILARELWEDQGNYLNNAVSLCDPCHILAEKTLVTPQKLRDAAGIITIHQPDHFDPDLKYDVWGNPYLNKDLRAQGELFHQDNVQKILKKANQLAGFSERTKYPKTAHFSFSPGLQNDDRLLPNAKGLEGEEIIAAIKFDGENATLTQDYTHARSMDSANHPSRNWLKALHGSIAHDIPPGLRICGENLYAQHSLAYDKLPSFFLVFNMWKNGKRLSWDTTKEYAELLGLHTVPVLYRGPWNEKKIQEICETLDPQKYEGIVVSITREISAGEWKRTSAKFVRKNHVQSDKLWMLKPVVPNQLAKTPAEVSYQGKPISPTPIKPKNTEPEVKP